MKAPDKIYLHGYSFDDEPCKDWHAEPKIKGMRGYPAQNVKYIREDSLPKWFQVEKDGCFDKPHKFLLDTKEGMFFCSGEIVPRDGYALFVDDLLGLPRVDIKP